jgi:hypothetical protein
MQVVTAEADKLTESWLEATTSKGLAGEQVLADFLAAQEDFAARRDADGYPWE